MLYRGAQILILDEPTAVLVPQEVDELFGNLRELKAEGLTIIFISHKLDEVLAVADEITVIRRGTTVGTVDPDDGHHPPARRADGRQRAARRRRPRESDRHRPSPLLTRRAASTLTGAGRPRRCSTTSASTIHRGEVLGIAGVEGNGQAELVEAHHGHPPRRPPARSRSAARTSPRWSTRRAARGRASATSRRTGTGTACCSRRPLWENRILGHQTRPPNATRPAASTAAAPAPTPSASSSEYDVRTPGIDVARLARCPAATSRS